MKNMPKTFEQAIIDMYGESGRLWLASLPSTVAQLADTWEITEIHPVTNLSYNYVATGIRHDVPVILKIGNSVTFGEFAVAREAEALTLLSGPCVKIIAQDDCLGALLLERLVPGKMLKELFPTQDQEGVAIASDMIKAFACCHTLAPIFTHLGDVFAVLDKDWSQLGQHLQKARDLRTSLIATTVHHVLLHGDLHHENILQHGNMWRVIDPKGFVGDPAYECGAYIRNPFPEILVCPDMLTIIKNRICMFADLLSLDEQRIAQWTYVQAVVAACWAIEDHLDACLWLELCDVLAQIL